MSKKIIIRYELPVILGQCHVSVPLEKIDGKTYLPIEDGDTIVIEVLMTK